MADIQLTDLTNATQVGNGTGIFDVLMQAVNRHIDEQFENGRIVGPEYATVYLGSIQSVLQESIKFLLGEQQADKQAELLQAQIDKTGQESDVAIAQATKLYEDIAASQSKTTRDNNESTQKIALMAAQTTGFTTDVKQKMLKQMLEAHAVELSINGSVAAPAPNSAKEASIDDVANDILTDVGSSVVVP